jgi:hypothetical protein
MFHLDSKYYSKLTTYHEKFREMARIIINNTSLSINNKLYRFCELEFYLNEKNHPDPFVHCNNDQKTEKRWYFHKQNNKSYKGGTYKGLDITFGYQFRNHTYGGILIRSIKDTENFIEGPCNVVNTILSNCNYKSIIELVSDEKFSSDITNNTSLLHLKLHKYPIETIYNGPRVGLTLKKYSRDKCHYIMRNYRFLIHPHKIKKYKHTLSLNLFINNNNEYKHFRNHKKYIEFFNKGKKMSYENFKDKKLTTSDICMLYGVYHKN